MDDTANGFKSKLKSILKSALSGENLGDDFSIEILGTSEKGDGYMGDILFVDLTTKTKTYNLVLKCAKGSQALRESIPVKEAFETEIYLYQKIFPEFRKFQEEYNVQNYFDSVPKCYGTFIGDQFEIIVLENLKMQGYKLYDRKKPQNSDHLYLILKEYGKWHAISAAMQDQYPEKFKELCEGISDVWGKFLKSMSMDKFFGTPVEETWKLLKDDISPGTIEKLKKLRSQVSYINQELIYDKTHFSVITHGDGWNNNFMFKYDQEKNKPLKVAILDWQVSKHVNPVLDLSYFLYNCIDQEQIQNFDQVLKFYHDVFAESVRELGSDPDKLYPFSQLLEDWPVFSKFGLMMALLIIKIALCQKDEVGDIAETVENGGDISDTFLFKIKDENELKNRLLYLLDHCEKYNVI